ncbi:MAG: type II toxin-antitoxin system HicA family toxin [Holophagaceae bacterium]|nr:type II toxin-antitoxin system HicA family toxin [Holophagaceae bacterium]
MKKIIKADGWRLDRVEGSHYQYEHPSKPGTVTIPRHSGDIPKFVIHSVYQQAQLKVKS